MFDEMEKDINAVIVATPDHSHFPAAVASMELGKHVFVEKPLAHKIWQVRKMKKAAKYYGIVSRMGNQGHTTNGIRLVKEWYEAGVLGEVKEVHGWLHGYKFEPNGFWRKPASFPPVEEPIPKHLDWDLWLGPASNRPYNSVYAPTSWRGFYDFANGQLGDWQCHTLDAPFWSLDLGMPHTVYGDLTNPVADRSFVVEKSVISYKFSTRGNQTPVTLKWHEGGSIPKIKPEWDIDDLPNIGMLMVGEKYTLLTGGRPYNPRLLISEEERQEFIKNAPPRSIPRVAEDKPVVEWIDAIKNNTLPGANFDYAANLTEMSLVGALAHRHGGKIEYDAETMKVTNRPELNAYIKEPTREGWTFGEGLL